MDRKRPFDNDGNEPWRSKYHYVLEHELKAINARRDESRQIGDAVPGKPLDVVGLALSGGGIRSASVGLGVLQALNSCDLLERVDYLSTVSGGGYIGCSLSAAMSQSGAFPFGAAPPKPGQGGKPEPLAADISDTPAVGHIRNYSNYLIPNGFRDALSGVAVIVRGLAANLLLIAPVLLSLAILTIYSNPSRSSLSVPDVFGVNLSQIVTERFGITLIVGLSVVVLYFFWAIARCNSRVRRLGLLDAVGWGALALLVLVALCEFQPFVIEGMFQIVDHHAGDASGLLLGLLTSWIQALAAVAAPVAGAVIFFQRQLGGLLKSVTADSDWTTMLAAYLTKAAIWIAGLALPLMLWMAYLYLCFWAISNDCRYLPPKSQQQSAASSTTVKSDALAQNSTIASRDKAASPAATQVRVCDPSLASYQHVPGWLKELSKKVQLGAPRDYFLRPLYWSLVVLFSFWTLFLLPNSNSLHQLYRDRLGKAFLFDPTPTRRPNLLPSMNEASRDQGRDFADLSAMKLSHLSDSKAPYHLINAALNIQGSDYANRRGRNADFFLFSRHWIGSDATNYARTSELETQATDLDLATAMAISGAAASANMGSKTIRPLTPTLALLNIRLGYWLTNPKLLAENIRPTRKRPAWLRNSTLYLWQELTGRLYENSESVYLTDGGHIENLGIYELLRRHCGVIIAVDAEADTAMHFPSLMTLQRYARIDLGIRIDLPWMPIRTETLDWMSSNAGKPPTPAPAPSHGPHAAVGIIDYGGGEKGYLVYLKSSLTGDENDYVRDYARRYAQFPHETTGDQFFSEEQFEVYRALGFHIAHGLLSGEDKVIAVVEDQPWVTTTFDDSKVESIAAVRRALGMDCGAVVVEPTETA